MLRRTGMLATVLLSLAAAGAARADWPASGVPLFPAFNSPYLVPDAGGVNVFITEVRCQYLGCNELALVGSRISSSGQVMTPDSLGTTIICPEFNCYSLASAISFWPAVGLGEGRFVGAYSITGHGFGAGYMFGIDSMFHVTWGPTASTAGVSPYSGLVAQPDGAGGFYSQSVTGVFGPVQSTWVTRLTGSGDTLWSAEVLPGEIGDLTSDGARGFFVTWYDATGSRAQRYSGSAQQLWGPNGIPLSDDSYARLIVDGSGGFFTVSAPYYPENAVALLARRFDSTGVAVAGWPSSGVPVFGSTGTGSFSAAVDGQGGLLVTQAMSDSSVRLQHFSAAGGLMPGWSPSGVSLARANTVQWQFVGDGFGGAYVAWSGARGDSAFVDAQHVTSDGRLGWGASGRRLAADAGFLAQYGLAGDGQHGAYVAWVIRSRGPAGSLTVQRLDPETRRTRTVLSSSQSPALVGGTVTLTAAVTPFFGGAVPSGSVELFDGGVPIATAPLVSGTATADYVLPATAGARAFTAVYSGDAGHDTSTAATIQQVVTRFTTTLVLAGDSSTVHGRDVLLVARIDPAVSGEPVTIRDESGVIGVVPLAGGMASLAYRAPRLGTRSFTAAYPGDATHEPSSAAGTVTFVGVSTTLSLRGSTDVAEPGEHVMLTATVEPAAASGAVTFRDGVVTLGTLPLVAGGASLDWIPPTIEFANLQASYSGDTIYSPSVGELQISVEGFHTSMSLTATAQQVASGSLVGFMARITPPVDSGTVTFWRDGTAFAAVRPQAGFAAAFDSLQAGDHSIRAMYSGSAIYHTCFAGPLLVHAAVIGGPYLRVLEPNHGETWHVGAPATIQWDASNSGVVTRVDLYLSRTDPPEWEPIASSVPNTGSYSWQVSGPGTNQGPVVVYSALVLVEDPSGRAGSDATDLPFSIVDDATPVRVTRLDAEAFDGGIRVTWALAAMDDRLELQRAPSPAGPWTTLASAAHEANGTVTADDRTVEPGATYWYRLVSASAGSSSVFGPVPGTAEAPREFALGAVTPNPARGTLALTFAVPRAAPIRLSVIDLQGREIAVLASDRYAPGRYRAAWDGATARGRVPAGIYFVRLTVPGNVFSTRLAIVR